MQVLDSKRQSALYQEYAIKTYADQHAHYYTNEDSNTYNRLFSIRSNPGSYIVNRENNVEYIDWRNAKQLTELRYCLNLKTLTATRTVKYRGQQLPLIASFDGLENGASGGMVWVHIPYTSVNSEFIRTLGWNEFLDHEVRCYLEHQMLVSGSKEAMVTCSDGTFAHSINYEYQSDRSLRESLLHHYAVFEFNLRTYNGTTSQNGFT